MTRSANTAVATADQVRQEEPVDPVRSLVRSVDARKPQLASLLGLELESERGRMMLDRFVTVALHAATSNPDLMRATTESLVESIRDAAMYGLEPVGFSGDGAIIVYDEKRMVEVEGSRPGTTVKREIRVPTASFSPMYRGLLKLARRSPELASIDAQVVYEGDSIEFESGTNPFVRHVPALDGASRGRFRGAYAYAKLRNGEVHVDYMTYAEIEVSRSKSRASNSLGWTSFWGEMARKTVLRRLMKRLPLESLAETAMRRESEAEDRAMPVVVSSTAPTPAVSEARARIASRFAPAISAGSTGSANGADGRDAETATDTVETVAAESGPIPETAAATDQEETIEARDICGAESDPALGPVETCVLAPDHDLAANGLKVHRSESGTVFPVEKRKEGTE